MFNSVLRGFPWVSNRVVSMCLVGFAVVDDEPGMTWAAQNVLNNYLEPIDL